MRPRLLILVLLLASVAAKAADLKVRVVDPRSTAVAGAQVAVYPAAGSRALGLQSSSAEGTAAFFELEPGEYRVEVLAPGFAPAELAVHVPTEIDVEVQLKVAGPEQTVVVTATRTPVPAEDSGASVALLDAQALEVMQPVSAGDAIRFISGAVVSANGQRGALTSLFVRGGESRYNKVLIDGVPVNDSDSFFDFGVVPMFEVDRIEMMRGADSALYGPDSMTSVIRLETRPGTTRVPELRFGAEGGNFDAARGFLSLSGVRHRFDYKVFGEQTVTDGQGINNEYSNAAQGANVGFAFTTRVRLRVRGRHSNNRTGVSSAWNFNRAPLLPPDQDQFARQNNSLASVELDVDSPARWQHHIRGFEYSHRLANQDLVADRGCDFQANIFFDCPFKTFSEFNRAGFEYQGEYAPRAWAHTVFGYLFDDEHGDLRDLLFGGPPTQGLRRNHAAYVEQIFPGARFSISGGLRYVHNESFGNKLVPRLAGLVTLARGTGLLAGTRLRFGVSQGIKAPDFLESFGNPSFFILPNPNLKAEQNLSLEGGVEQNLAGRWTVSAVYFHNSFRDQIDLPSLGPPQGIFVNLNKTLAHGAELELNGRVGRFTVRSGYTYLSTQVLEAPLDPARVGTALLRRPKHTGSLLLGYMGKRWGGDLAGSFVGRRPDSDFLGLGIDHAAGYALVNTGAWFAVNHYMTAYLNVENVLNRRYQEVVGYPALGVSFRAGMRFRVGGE